MKRLLLLLPLLTLVACQPPDQTARDVNASLSGAITAAQSQYLTTCKANSMQTPCLVINRAVDGQNALTTALETYCGWSKVSPPPAGTPCVPQKSAGPLLQAAIQNAQRLTTEVKGLVKP